MTNGTRMRVALTLLLGLSVLSSASCSKQGTSSKDLHLTVLLRDDSGLSPGDDIRLGTLRVGEVKKIKKSRGRVEVQAVVRSEYRDRVTQDAQFQVEKESALSKHRYLRLAPGADVPVPDNAEFVGSSRVGVRLPDWVTETKDALTSPEIRKRWADFTEAVEDAASKGKDEWQNNKPRLEEKAKQLYETVREEAPELAARIKKEMDRLLREVEERVES